jgi:hypothetical protein
MADFLSELASEVGLEDEQAHHGLGAILTTLKNKLDPEVFAHLKNSIPNSEELLSAFQNKAGSAGGGLVDTMKNMAGQFFGKGESSEPQTHYATSGLSTDQLKSLLPKLHDMIADKVPPHVLDQIKQHLPGFGPGIEGAEEE